MVSRKTRRWRDRGAAAVEFALIVPALVTLIFGSIEFGLAVQARTMVGNAAREGVRVASLTGSMPGSKAGIEAAALNAVSGVSGTATVDVVCKTPAGVVCTIGSTGAAGNIATVTVTLSYAGITGLFDPLLNKPIVAASYMRIEG
jgi:Flp pilus assembly protein TadG